MDTALPQLTLTAEDYVLAARHAITTGDDATLEHAVPIILAAACRAGLRVVLAIDIGAGPLSLTYLLAGTPAWWIQTLAPLVDTVWIDGEQVTP